jgi:hypothetical protein
MQPYKNISYEKHSHNVPSPSPQPRPLKPPSVAEDKGTLKPPKNATASGPLQGQPGWGGRRPGPASAHPVVRGAGQLAQLPLEVQVDGKVQVTLQGAAPDQLSPQTLPSAIPTLDTQTDGPNSRTASQGQDANPLGP